MQAAEHGASFPKAQKLRKSMTHSQLHDFAVGPMKNKPEHAGLLKGDSPDIMKTNMRSMRQSGKSELDATRTAIMKSKPKGHPSRHKNLGAYLHKGKK